jgi:hypothetical protein
METAACRFWMVSWTVTRRPFHAEVALAMSSPTFLGDWGNCQGTQSWTRLIPYQTERTDFWGQCRGCTDLTSGGTEVDDFYLIGVLEWMSKGYRVGEWACSQASGPWSLDGKRAVQFDT